MPKFSSTLINFKWNRKSISTLTFPTPTAHNLLVWVHRSGYLRKFTLSYRPVQVCWPLTFNVPSRTFSLIRFLFVFTHHVRFCLFFSCSLPLNLDTILEEGIKVQWYSIYFCHFSFHSKTQHSLHSYAFDIFAAINYFTFIDQILFFMDFVS